MARAEAGTVAWRRDMVAFRGPGLLARPDARIVQVAAEHGIGERQLRRRFERVVGLVPLGLSAPRPGPLRPARPAPAASGSLGTRSPAIAHRRGFTDQSHLTREVVALTGLTPARLR